MTALRWYLWPHRVRKVHYHASRGWLCSRCNRKVGFYATGFGLDAPNRRVHKFWWTR